LFSFVEAALPTAKSALRLLRNLAFDAHFPQPGLFLERLAELLLAVSDPVVLCDVARAFGFAARHAEVAPRAVEILGGFLEHCDSLAAPGSTTSSARPASRSAFWRLPFRGWSSSPADCSSSRLRSSTG
jgi:hypothetical protein